MTGNQVEWSNELSARTLGGDTADGADGLLIRRVYASAVSCAYDYRPGLGRYET